MENLTMCGYCCDLCKAFAPNIQNNDEREVLSRLWSKYYGLDIKAEQISCDGCREIDGKRLDSSCPVRKCVVQKEVDNCGNCSSFSCSNFNERKGLSLEEAQEKLGTDFSLDEYNNYLLAYDNMTRLKEYIKNKYMI
jgi:hypothetical protein